MSTWPFSWLAMTALVLAIVLIVTCSPWRAKSPSFCAMYSPARSADGMAATVTFRSPGLDSAVSPASRYAVLHPASVVITAAASAAARTCQVFIFTPPGIAADPGLTSRCYQRVGRPVAMSPIRNLFVPQMCHKWPHCEQTATGCPGRAHPGAPATSRSSPMGLDDERLDDPPTGRVPLPPGHRRPARLNPVT